MPEGDADLRELFRQLRHRTDSRAPSFDATLRAAHRAPRGTRTLLGAAAVVAMLVLATAAIWLVRPRPERLAIREERLAFPTFAAPTDFLLRTPGHEVLTDVPTFTDAITKGPGDSPPGGRP